jgi:hypothetical protein
VLHASDAAVAFCVFRDVHLAEDAEEGHVEDATANVSLGSLS